MCGTGNVVDSRQISMVHPELKLKKRGKLISVVMECQTLGLTLLSFAIASEDRRWLVKG